VCYRDRMARRERWTALLEMLSADGRIEIDDAAGRLQVSSATIRRDLDELANQQLLVRDRGGAIPHTVSYDLPLRYKSGRHADQKRRIAAVAAGLVGQGGVVGLNGGTTTTEVARALATRGDLHQRTDGADTSPAQITVVTNALNIAHELAVRPHVKLVVTGGVARPQSYELTGPLALPVIQQLTLDLAFIGADAISAAGASTNNENEAAVNRELASRARKVVVVADSSKLGRSAFARICPASDIDVLVTGGDTDRRTLDELRDAGIEVLTTS
jgi:DeoR family transcriptional regulator, aga operon transcriptional repressor